MYISKRVMISFALTILGVITIYTIHQFFKTEDRPLAPVISTDITDVTFQPPSGHLYLLYPYLNIWADENEPKDTYLVEIDQDGNIMNEESIQDSNFGAISLDVKTTRPDTLFGSLNSGQYANHYYTFNLDTKRFNKEDITYFEHDVMLDSISHQGEQTWFKSIASYQTGTQTYVEGLGMSMTISNVEERQNYLTPPQNLPTHSPLLETENHIAYVSAGEEGSDGEDAAMVFLDRVTGEATVYRGEEEPYEYTALHTDGNNTYFADSLGMMHRIDASGKKTSTYHQVIDNAYYNSYEGIRMIDANIGYQIVSKYDSETSVDELMMVKWLFGKDFSVEKMNLPYWDENNLYRYLYYNPILKRSYLTEVGEDDKSGRLLIVDENLKLINAIRIDYPMGVDLVVE